MPSQFAAYLSWDLERLLEELARVQSTLAGAATERARARSSEIEAKALGWKSSTETTVRGREHVSSYEAAPATATKLELEGMMGALEEEKGFLLTVIDVRLRSSVPAWRPPVRADA